MMKLTQKYKTKLVVIDAWLWEGETTGIPDWITEKIHSLTPDKMVLNTLEGPLTSLPGYYIIRGTEGEVYECKPSVFHKKYELCEGVTNAKQGV